MLPPGLKFTTTDISEAKEFLDETYGWRITVRQPSPDGSPLTVSMIEAGQIILGRPACAPGDISYVVTGGEYVVFDTLLEGTFEIGQDEHARRYGPGDVYIANHPRADFASSTHDVYVLTTTVPLALLADMASTDPDQDSLPVEFSSHTPIKGDARRWRAVCPILRQPAR